MLTRGQYVERITGGRQAARSDSAEAFMPSNIALVKYWGKRRGELNLPLVSSLSYTLEGYGTKTRIALADRDSAELNGKPATDEDLKKITAFLDLFRAPGEHYRVVTENNIPTAAGVASSASGFAALTSAILALKGLEIPLKGQSMLARLGSGSAARSFWPGLVLWHKGERDDGMDCYAEPLARAPGFCMAVLLLDQGKKPWSSRQAMEISLSTSPLAAEWPAAQQRHLDAALAARDVETLGAVAEENAVLLHRLLAESSPSIVFDLPETTVWKQKVREWRAGGLPVWFTQDAGPNLKLLFPLKNKEIMAENLRGQGVDYFIV